MATLVDLLEAIDSLKERRKFLQKEHEKTPDIYQRGVIKGLEIAITEMEKPIKGR